MIEVVLPGTRTGSTTLGGDASPNGPGSGTGQRVELAAEPWGDAIPGGLVEWAGDGASTSGPARRRAGRWGRLLRRTIGPVSLVGLWQILSVSGVIDVKVLPSPWQVLDTFWQLTAHGPLPGDLSISLRRAGEGVLVGGSLGLVLGVISGLWRIGEELFDSTMQMLRTVPFIALWPLLIVWFGVGEAPKILLVAFASAFPIYINVFAGIRNVDKRLIESARVVGLSTRRLIREVVLPGALPQALVGLRISLGVSVIALVAAEQINATSGIGYMMQTAEQFVQINVIIVGLIVYALIGLSVDLIVRFLERVLLRWRQAFVGA